MSGEVSSLAADRELRMSEPDRLTSRDDTASVLDTRCLSLRILVGAFMLRSSATWSSVPPS